MQNYQILVCEDEVEIGNAIEIYLKNQGYGVHRAYNGKEGLEVLARQTIHLAIVDLMMPVMDGLTMIMTLRQSYDFPVIVLSAKSEDMDKITGLNMGADDFVTKPFQIDVLIAKINALLRRSYNYSDTDSEVLSHNGITLNVDNGRMEIRGEMIDLSKNEYRLLYLLMKKHGKILTREKLLRALWDDERFVDDNTLTVNINRLRKKIEQAGIAGYIETKVGVGYMVP